MTFLVIAACASSPAPPATPPPELTRAPASLAEIARDMIDGRTGALFEVHRFRSFPSSGHAIGRLGRWAETLDALDLDPSSDVARALVVAPYALSTARVVVLEMDATDEAVAAAFARGHGDPLPDAPFPRTLITLDDGEEVAVALVRPRTLVMAPTYVAWRFPELRSATKLPPPDARAAARFFAFEPASSLGATPSWPESVVAAHAEIQLLPDGAAEIRFFALSTSDDQAARDAKFLTKEAHDLLTLDLALFQMELLTPPEFASRGRVVEMKTELLPGDVDWILRFSGGS
jgi:hypothetical protein